MATNVSSDRLARKLQELLERLPTGEVPLEWVDSQLEVLRFELQDEPLSTSHSLIDHGAESEVISLLDLTGLEATDGSGNHTDLPVVTEGRYLPRATLGAGGQGIVREVRDRFLERNVALKVLRAELTGNTAATRLFLREARITGQLNHAGIAPIYDVSVLSDGTPCYTMRRIRGRSLRDILVDLREHHARVRASGQAGTPREFTRRRLLEVLVSAAHAVGYAHDRGVIHRDLKPGNLMVGDYGEVLVLDWGIARLLGRAAPDSIEEPVVIVDDPEHTLQGTIKGTPGYMAPEQAYGDIAAQGPWTDVFALGLILYEILAGMPARRPGSSEDVLRVARDPILESPETRRQREGIPVAAIPEELEQICMTCISRDPRDRYPDGEALADALQSYLDGEQRREVAEQRAKEAEQRVSLLEGMGEDITRRKEEARLLLEAVEPWAGTERKRVAWEKEDEVKAAELRRDQTLVEAFALYTQALGNDPENPRARRGQARLYYDLLLEAEFWGRMQEARRYEAQVRRLDDGSLREALQGDGMLHLTTDPPGATAWLFDLVEQDRRLQPVAQRILGQTPLSIRLPMGRYLVVIRSGDAGRELEVVYPILIRRLGEWRGHVRLYPSLPKSFVLVPGGPFIFGGDRMAPGSGPREERELEDFAIGRFPVTCAEYLEFLQGLERLNPQEALARAPRPTGHGGMEPLWPRSREGGFRIPRVDILGGRWAPELPVRCISRDDAEAYCHWRSPRDGVRYRLPTELEWEKAGRGVDGRFFPWGNSFEATFCKMKDSRPGPPEPEGVGAFPLDSSPYGVQDLAGGVIEWVAGPFDRHGILAIQKGGFWMASQANCRLARRFGVFPTEPEPFAGFRLAFTPVW